MPEPSNRGVYYPPQPQHKQPEQGTLAGIKEKAEDVASSVASTAQNAWESSRHQVENAASQIGQTAEQAFDDVVGFIRRYPLACVAGGFFVGFLAAGALGGMSHLSSRS